MIKLAQHMNIWICKQDMTIPDQFSKWTQKNQLDTDQHMIPGCLEHSHSPPFEIQCRKTDKFPIHWFVQCDYGIPQFYPLNLQMLSGCKVIGEHSNLMGSGLQYRIFRTQRWIWNLSAMFLILHLNLGAVLQVCPYFLHTLVQNRHFGRLWDLGFGL